MAAAECARAPTSVCLHRQERASYRKQSKNTFFAHREQRDVSEYCISGVYTQHRGDLRASSALAAIREWSILYANYSGLLKCCQYVKFEPHISGGTGGCGISVKVDHIARGPTTWDMCRRPYTFPSSHLKPARRFPGTRKGNGNELDRKSVV